MERNRTDLDDSTRRTRDESDERHAAIVRWFKHTPDSGRCMAMRRRLSLPALLTALLTMSVVVAGCTLPPPLPLVPPVPPAPGGAGTPGTPPKVGGCSIFPADNAWNQDVSKLPVRAGSATYVANITSAGKTNLHPDFGGGGAYGIPFVVVPATEPKRAVNYTAYGDESDPGPFPIPPTAPVEGGAASDGDRHVIALQQGTCRVYELGRAFWQGDHWDADVGVNWNLSSNALRPLGWTSADAAGLSIFAGLVRYDEVASGEVRHAIRFTAPRTQRAYIFPATHYASSNTDPGLPPMGLRLRLKANFNLAPYHGQSLVILEALKKYGMIVADNGSSWYLTGASDPRWNDDDLRQLKSVPGSAFEVVDTGPIRK
jgi:hypothetical protein